MSRPRLHLTPRRGWLNDPHGLCFVDGTYHLFFQHVPDSTEWLPGISWGHATSRDLLRWTIESDAIAPGDGDQGCWSGCAVVADDGPPVLFYTSVVAPDLGLGRVRVARFDPDRGTWVKGEIVASSMDPAGRMFRDPMVFRDGDTWRMWVGSGTTDGTAGAQSFSSADLRTWRFDGWAATRHVTTHHPWTGSGWECPQILRGVDGHDLDVLVVSIWDDQGPHEVAAASGRLVDGRFQEERWRLVSAGLGHFAASAFSDSEGRPCLIFWIRGISDPGRWTGALSIPYVVSGDAEGIVLAPHPCVAEARRGADGRPGMSLDLEWSPAPGEELTLVGTDGRDRALVQAGPRSVRISVPGLEEPVEVAHESRVLRIVVDAQVLEVVADGGLVGLGLSDPEGGFAPRASVPEHLAWWHL